jgi:hypothetical protein
MKSYKVAAIPGDGIGQEVVAAGVEVMHAIARRDRRPEMASIRARWNGVSAVAFYGPGAVHEGHDIVQMKVLSDRRGEGGGIAWLVRYSRARACGSARISARGCRQSHSVAGSSSGS